MVPISESHGAAHQNTETRPRKLPSERVQFILDWLWERMTAEQRASMENSEKLPLSHAVGPSDGLGVRRHPSGGRDAQVPGRI